MHYAAEDDCLEALKWLLEHNTNALQEEDTDGRTPFALAASKGNTKAMELLSKASSDINTKDSEGRTPLEMA